MNKLIATLSVATLLVACGQSADTPQPEAPVEAAAEAGKIFDIPYLERDLDNGLRVVIVPTDYPNIVTIQIPVQTGSRNEVEAGKTTSLSRKKIWRRSSRLKLTASRT